MPRAEAGSAKAIGNAIKAKGLTKLRFYCQVCQKACRDENGYKCHIESESHMRQIAALGNNAGRVIDNFSKEFQDGFVALLSRRFGTAKINANKVYQEYIQERHHVHMNATRWVSLSEFVKHLGRQGVCKVEEITDEGQFGWYVSWVDNSPAALARQDALQKMERAKVDEEGRMRKLLNQQIERAKEKEASGEGADESARKVEQGIQRGSGAPVSLKLGGSGDGSGGGTHPDALGARPGNGASASSSVEASKPVNAFKAPIFGRNALKSSSTGAPRSTLASTSSAFHHHHKKAAASDASSIAERPKSKTTSLTAAERIMAEEQALREKRRSMGPQPSAKRTRM